MNKKGLTLVDILIIVAMVGLITSIAVPAGLRVKRQKALEEDQANFPRTYIGDIKLPENIEYWARFDCYFRRTDESKIWEIVELNEDLTSVVDTLGYAHEDVLLVQNPGEDNNNKLIYLAQQRKKYKQHISEFLNEMEASE